jgi:hypothetical protein
MNSDLYRAAQTREVVAALLEFERLPGRYPVAMREPRILFEQAGLVLLLAAGRKPAGLAGSVEPELRQAARFFVRTVMLRPGVDFYTLLGLPQVFGAEALREHYRLMIRMTHPDFMVSGVSWPADAAARINQAHDVLASDVKRAGYRATLDGARAKAVSPGITAHGPRPRARADAATRRWPIGKTLGLAAAVALLALSALLLSWPSSDVGLLSVAVRPVPARAVESPPVALANTKPAVLPAPLSPTRPLPQVPQVPTVLAVMSPRELSPPVAAAPVPAVPAEAVPVPLVRVAMAPVAAVQELVLPAAPVAAAELFSTPPVVVVPAVMAPVKAAEVIAPNITLDQVQPLLTNVLQSLQSGRSEQVLQWLERPARQGDAAARFVAAYNQSLAGYRVTGLGPMGFSSRFTGGQLVVDGMVQLALVDERQQASSKDFRLRAYFLSRDSTPVLARLEAN